MTNPNDAVPIPSLVPSLPLSRGKKILVVDDEPGIRDLLSRMLSAMGFEVETAGDGREALDRLAADFPDLLILDLSMPGMDGIEVLGSIQRSGWRLPTVMLSGLGDLDLAKLSLRLGASIYLTKPFDKADLKRTVEWYLASAPSFSRANLQGA